MSGEIYGVGSGQLLQGDFYGVGLMAQRRANARLHVSKQTTGSYTIDSTQKYETFGSRRLSLVVSSVGGTLAGGETVTMTLYKLIPEVGTYFSLGTITAVVPAATTGTYKKALFTDSSNLLIDATHFSLSGTITIAASVTATFGVSFDVGADESYGSAISDTIVTAISGAYSSLTSSFQVSETAPLDQRMTAGTLVIDTTTDITAGNTLCYPAAAATPTSCWDIGALNAGSGHAKMITLTGHIKTSALSGTAVLEIYGSNDPNATVASKRWSKVGFYENTSTIRNYVADITVTSTGSAVTYNYAIDLNEWGYRYMYIAFTANTLAIDEHSAYICASY